MSVRNNNTATQPGLFHAVHLHTDTDRQTDRQTQTQTQTQTHTHTNTHTHKHTCIYFGIENRHACGALASQLLQNQPALACTANDDLMPFLIINYVPTYIALGYQILNYINLFIHLQVST